jgi:hypothetical protein
MANTAKGRLYARLIDAGRTTLADVPEASQTDTRDSYLVLFGIQIE